MSVFSKLTKVRGLKRLHTTFSYCTNSEGNYKNSIFLPKTDFPHRIKATNIVNRDQEILEKGRFDELYEWQLQNTKGSTFILHDGPPYANGDVHIGHAVNKILKDITIRYKLLNGHQIHFVPGWDCHGLPIELKVLKSSNTLNSQESKLEIRKRAFKFAEATKVNQLDAFKKWGLLADWKNSYATFHPDYISNEWKVFCSLYEKKLIYADYRPVYWSPSNRTSLAEAELEYNTEHVSTSVYVKFPISKYPGSFLTKLGQSSKLFALIWTTTPWTLPANQAICYAENKEYCIVQRSDNDELFIVAADMVEVLAESINMNLSITQKFNASCLKEFRYSSPLFQGEEFPFLSARHVTMSKGTGLVHMAPNHGLEDYAAAQEHNTPIAPSIVDENGAFQHEAGEALAGKEVLGLGTESVLKLLGDHIICINDYKHSYPYDWRSNKPVIVRSSHQWFLDVASLKSQIQSSLNEVEVIPNILKKTFQFQLEKAPQWCISRQRAWGVPIPVLYQGQENIPIINRKIIDHLCYLIKERGIHFWWELSEDELLPKSLREKCNLPDVQYRKGEDILDIWVDSGISWHNVLPNPKISDICLEGVDQIRGWFNSSLITSVATRGAPPYKKLFLHGFTTDASGNKMSKSKGNVISPLDITDGNKNNGSPALGVDVLRWWIAYHACQHENIALKSTILDECTQNISKIRNVVKFLLGSLYQFNFDKDAISPIEMRPLDQYMLHLVKLFLEKVDHSYNSMQYKNAAKEILNFITNDVSSYYCQIIKDRLYCDSKASLSHRSCRTTISMLFDVVIKCLAPITPHLVEEAFLCHPYRKAEGVFHKDWSTMTCSLSNISYSTSILWANEIRNAILKLEKKTTHMDVYILGSAKVLHHLRILQPVDESLEGNLCELFQASRVCLTEFSSNEKPLNYHYLQSAISKSLAEDKKEWYSVILKPSSLEVCPRCRRSTSTCKATLCQRCAKVIASEESPLIH